MHKALYRVYRPKTFEDVVGQEHIVKTLKNQIKNNNIGHAYLFSGTRGNTMDTYAISEDSVALLLPDKVTPDVGRTVRALLRMAGITPWERMEAELFTLGDASLLLARPAPPRTKRLSGPGPRPRRKIS